MKSLVCVLAVLSLAGPVSADLTRCTGIGTSAPFKIALDDIVSAGAAADQGALLDRLVFKLRGELDAAIQESGLTADIQYDVFPCPNRRPQSSDFESELIQQLNTSNVLLEVFGSVSTIQGRAAGALITFAVIPVRFYGADHTPGVYTVEYPRRTAATANRQIVDLFAKEWEPKVFLNVALGVKLMKLKKHELAARCFRQANFVLSKMTGQDMASLKKFVCDQTLENARATPNGAALAALSFGTQGGGCVVGGGQ
jgi:hypothetical protein